VAGSCEEGDEPSGSGTTESVGAFLQTQTLCFIADILLSCMGLYLCVKDHNQTA
jgi:hypothetical protein